MYNYSQFSPSFDANLKIVYSRFAYRAAIWNQVEEVLINQTVSHFTELFYGE